jgi:hypothetical protein
MAAEQFYAHGCLEFAHQSANDATAPSSRPVLHMNSHYAHGGRGARYPQNQHPSILLSLSGHVVAKRKNPTKRNSPFTHPSLNISLYFHASSTPARYLPPTSRLTDPTWSRLVRFRYLQDKCHMWRYGSDLSPVWTNGAHSDGMNGMGGSGVGDVIAFASSIYGNLFRSAGDSSCVVVPRLLVSLLCSGSPTAAFETSSAPLETAAPLQYILVLLCW